MTRKRAPLVPIVSAKTRCSTYKKRKETLMKKTSELSELCGEDACIVVYGPHSREPDVWPSQEKTLRILSSFVSAPEVQRKRNMVDQKRIVSKQVEKLQVELRRVEEENCRLEAMILLQDVLDGRCALADVADAGRMSRLSANVDTRLNEVRGRMNELLSVPQSVGPLEEVLLQQAPLYWPRTDVALLSQEQFSFDLTGVDMAPQVLEQYIVGLERADVSSTVHEQRTDGLSSAGVASSANEQYVVDWVTADMAPAGQKQCAFGLDSVDMPPLLDEQLCSPNWCAVVGRSEKGHGPESADVAAMPLGPDAEDEISQLFDWSCSGFEEILASI